MKKLALGLLAVTLLCGCGTKEAKISMEEAKEAALKEFQGDIIQSNKDEDDGKGSIWNLLLIMDRTGVM